MRLEDVASQSESSIKEANQRYTPGLDPKAPNLRVAHLDNAVDALFLGDGFRERLTEHADDLKEVMQHTRHSMDPVFDRRTVTPQVFLSDLMHLSSLNKPDDIRKQVRVIRRRGGYLERAMAREQQEIQEKRTRLTDEDKEKRNQLDSYQQDVFRLGRAIRSALGYVGDHPGRLLADNNTFLVLGSWGTGKTHFMCDLARRAFAEGAPALLVLANSLDPETDPLDAVASYTGLAANSEELLDELDALGAAQNRRSLILIDAINEGDRDEWRRTLSSVVRRVRAHRNVALVLTCRTPFDRTMFTDRTRALFVTTEHWGFEEQEFDAQLEFFSYYSIPAPHVPLIAPEFSRPLFLKILCEALAKLSRRSRGRKLREISSGQKGMTHVLEYFVTKVGADIEADFGLQRKTCWTILKGKPQVGNPGLAGIMAARSRPWLSPTDAVGEIRTQTGLSQQQAHALLDRFLTDGLLSETVGHDGTAWIDVVTFPYQRFGDHLTARHLLEAHLNTSSETAVRRCFYANRPLGQIFLLDEWKREFQEPGLAAAIMLEFPERMKRTTLDRELVHYLPRARLYVAPLKDVFLDGLYWRSADSFTPETSRIISFFLAFDDDQVRDETLEVLVTLAARHEHPYNARTLNKYLAPLPMSERDLRWSEYLRGGGHLAALQRILTWVERRLHSRASGAIVRNDIVILSLGLTTTDRSLRDRLTRAIFEMGLTHPRILFEEVLKSLEFNDPYVPERMLAAAYGVVMRLWADPKGERLREAVVPFARELVRQMFLPGATHGTTHELMRGYALGTIELCRKINPNSIATQHARYLKPPMAHLDSPFRSPNQISDADVASVKNALHMDFENYTIGALIPNRSPYETTEPYSDVRNQILDRIRQLGYDSSKFDEIDKQVSRFNWDARDSVKTDRYGKKYSWVAYFEMYGLRNDRGLLPEWRQNERTADCDVDPSFPDPPRVWKPRLPRPFRNTPTAPGRWLTDGPNPNYRRLLRRETADRQRGPWILLDGYVTQAGSHKREVFTFLRSTLLEPQYVDLFRRLVEQEAYLGNSKIPEAPGDYYTYMGEIPWSARYGPDVRNRRGSARRQTARAFSWYENGRWTGIPVEVPVRRWAWESHHTELTQIGGVTFPAPAICETLGLVSHNGSLDLRDPLGRLATLYREWPNENGRLFSSRLLYIREDLLQRYLDQTGQRLVWVPWGERTLHYELLNRITDPDVQEARSNHSDNYGELLLYDPQKVS